MLDPAHPPTITESDAFQATTTHMDNPAARFHVQNVDVAFVNSWRRTMISEVATLAFSKVFFIRQESELPDEFLAHRIGLIPIRIEPHLLDRLYFPHLCPCRHSDDVRAGDFCPNCEVIFTLEVNAGPTGVTIVHSEHLQYQPNPQADWLEPPPVPVRYFLNGDGEQQSLPIPIIKLTPGRTFHLIARATKGMGRLHAKWSPVCTTYMQYVPDVIVNESSTLQPNEVAKIAASCCRNVFEKVDPDDPTADHRLRVRDASACIFCRECIVEADHYAPGLVSVHRRRGPAGAHDLNVTIETTGALSPHEVGIAGLRVLKAKLRAIRESLEAPGKEGGEVPHLIGLGKPPDVFETR